MAGQAEIQRSPATEPVTTSGCHKISVSHLQSSWDTDMKDANKGWLQFKRKWANGFVALVEVWIWMHKQGWVEVEQ